MAEDKLERIYMIPLGDAYEYTRKRRVPRAVKLLRQFVSRHMKAELGDVSISNALNSVLWERSIQKPPRRVKVRVVKKEGLVRVYLPDEMTEEEKKSKKEAEEKAAKEKKEAAKPATPKPATSSEKKPEVKPVAPKPVEEKKSEPKPSTPVPKPAEAGKVEKK
jgi:large subunit ribosomal protein L31e